MNTIRTVFLFSTTALLFIGCKRLSKKEIKENANKALTILFEKDHKKVFVSNIYKDKELGDLFLEKPNENIIQITNDKQNISVLLLDTKRNGVIYGQSQNDRKLPKLVAPLIINSPVRFSNYKIVFYDLNRDTLKGLLDLSSQNIMGIIENMSFLDNGKTLTFQTHYGEIFFLDLNSPQKAVKFIPTVHYPSQFKFDELFNLKTDGKKNLIFDAISGYKSEKDKSYVYNTFQYNLESHQVKRITNTPFYLIEELVEE